MVNAAAADTRTDAEKWLGDPLHFRELTEFLAGLALYESRPQRHCHTEFADMLKAIFKRQRFEACTPDAPHKPTADDAWTDALIADLETLQTAAVDDGPNFLWGNRFTRVRQIR
jgi:hypothetical protein